MVVENGAPSELAAYILGGMLLGQHVIELWQNVPWINDVIPNN